MSSPTIIQVRAGTRGRLRTILSEASFRYFICQQMTSQGDMLKFPGVTRKILEKSREHYRDKYGSEIEACHRKNLSKSAEGNTRGSRPPSTLFPRETIEAPLKAGVSVWALARKLNTTEWFILRNCLHYGLSQEFVLSKVLPEDDIKDLCSVFPSLTPANLEDKAALRKAATRLRRLRWLLHRLGAGSGGGSMGEVSVSIALDEAGIEYETEYFITKDTKTTGSLRVDFYIPSRRAAIEVDGAYHGGQRGRDSRVDAECASQGIRLIRIPYNTVSNAFLKEVYDAVDSLRDQ